jgi:hypothetical protein
MFKMKKQWVGTCLVKGERVGNYVVEYDPSAFRRPSSYHFLCPDCGDKWCSLLTEQVGQKEYHAAISCSCESCNGGGITLLTLGGFNFIWDADILKRDVMVLSAILLDGKTPNKDLRFRLL